MVFRKVNRSDGSQITGPGVGTYLEPGCIQYSNFLQKRKKDTSPSARKNAFYIRVNQSATT